MKKKLNEAFISFWVPQKKGISFTRNHIFRNSKEKQHRKSIHKIFIVVGFSYFIFFFLGWSNLLKDRLKWKARERNVISSKYCIRKQKRTLEGDSFIMFKSLLFLFVWDFFRIFFKRIPKTHLITQQIKVVYLSRFLFSLLNSPGWENSIVVNSWRKQLTIFANDNNNITQSQASLWSF